MERERQGGGEVGDQILGLLMVVIVIVLRTLDIHIVVLGR